MLEPLGIHRPKQTTFNKPHTLPKKAKIVTTSTTRLLVLETSRKTQYTWALNGTIYIPREVGARPAPVVGISLSQQPQQENWPTHTPHAPSVQFSSNPWTAASLSITNSRSLLTLMYVESVMPSNHLILCHPLLLPPSVFPSIWVFSNQSVLLIRWPKYWSFNFSISPSNEYSGLISFRMDWLDLLAVQGTLKSLFQHHSSKASILRCSAFFMVQLSHRYMTTGKTIALTRWIFVGKVMSLLFNMLSRFVIAFLPRSKHLNFMAAVTICNDFGTQENKIFHCFTTYLLWSDGTGCCFAESIHFCLRFKGFVNKVSYWLYTNK